MKVYVEVTKRGKVEFEDVDGSRIGAISRTKKAMVGFLRLASNDNGYLEAELTIKKEGE